MNDIQLDAEFDEALIALVEQKQRAVTLLHQVSSLRSQNPSREALQDHLRAMLHQLGWSATR